MAKKDKSFRSMILFGLVFFLTGLLIILVSADVIPSDEASFNAPRWVVGIAGSVFLFSGLTVIGQTLFDKYIHDQVARDLFTQFMGLLILIGFGITFTWVGLGPGEREFTSSSSVGGVGIAGSGNVSVGRIVFGGVGLIVDIVVIYVFFNWLKKLVKEIQERFFE